MYSRSYKQDGDVISIPESYGGVAFREPEVKDLPEDTPKGLAKSADIPFTAPEPPDPKLSANAEESVAASGNAVGGFFSSIMEKIPFKNVFSGIDLGRIAFPKIGTEEILIIGLAIFLFLSREGDKECAVLLLLLLLIH